MKNPLPWIVGGLVLVLLLILGVRVMDLSTQVQNLQERVAGSSDSSSEPSAGEGETSEIVLEGEAEAPKRIDVPGSRATLQIPGEWQVEAYPQQNPPLLVLSDGEGFLARITTTEIHEEDFQAWFKKNGAAYVTTPEWKGDTVVGPNQVLIGNKLAIDHTQRGSFVGQADGYETFYRTTLVRDGGTVVVFNAYTPVDQATSVDLWDTALQTLTFPQ